MDVRATLATGRLTSTPDEVYSLFAAVPLVRDGLQRQNESAFSQFAFLENVADQAVAKRLKVHEWPAPSVKDWK